MSDEFKKWEKEDGYRYDYPPQAREEAWNAALRAEAEKKEIVAEEIINNANKVAEFARSIGFTGAHVIYGDVDCEGWTTDLEELAHHRGDEGEMEYNINICLSSIRPFSCEVIANDKEQLEIKK